MKKIGTGKFISLICKDLRIKKPGIVRKDTLEGTALAYYDVNKDILYLKREYPNPYDMYFAVSHELRHVWQVKNGMDLTGHKSNLEIPTREYNLQKEEIDANAYAYLILVSVFRVKPLFEGLDEDIKKMITSRAKEIVGQ